VCISTIDIPPVFCEPTNTSTSAIQFSSDESERETAIQARCASRGCNRDSVENSRGSSSRQDGVEHPPTLPCRYHTLGTLLDRHNILNSTCSNNTLFHHAVRITNPTITFSETIRHRTRSSRCWPSLPTIRIPTGIPSSPCSFTGRPTRFHPHHHHPILSRTRRRRLRLAPTASEAKAPPPGPLRRKSCGV